MEPGTTEKDPPGKFDDVIKAVQPAFDMALYGAKFVENLLAYTFSTMHALQYGLFNEHYRNLPAYRKSLDNITNYTNEHGIRHYPKFLNGLNDMHLNFYKAEILKLQHLEFTDIKAFPRVSEMRNKDYNVIDKVLALGTFKLAKQTTEKAETYLDDRYMHYPGKANRDSFWWLFPPKSETRMGVYKPKMLKTEDFNWHGNLYCSPIVNNFMRMNAIPTFVSQEQMDNYMSRFVSYEDYFFRKDFVSSDNQAARHTMTRGWGKNGQIGAKERYKFEYKKRD